MREVILGSYADRPQFRLGTYAYNPPKEGEKFGEVEAECGCRWYDYGALHLCRRHAIVEADDFLEDREDLTVVVPSDKGWTATNQGRAATGPNPIAAFEAVHGGGRPEVYLLRANLQVAPSGERADVSFYPCRWSESGTVEGVSAARTEDSLALDLWVAKDFDSLEEAFEEWRKVGAGEIEHPWRPDPKPARPAGFKGYPNPPLDTPAGAR